MTPSHVHIIKPPARAWGFQRAHCAKCGVGLGFLLSTEPVVQIQRPGSFPWTWWRELPTKEVMHG